MVAHTKSASITNLDAGVSGSGPAVANTAGQGAASSEKTIDDFVTVIASDPVGSTYQIVRVPSNCKVKSVVLESEAQGAGAFDIGVYYATDGEGGEPTTLLVANAIYAAFFAHAVNCASAVTPTNETNQSGNYTLNLRSEPLWQAAGLTSDPGGWFDIVATVNTTAVTTGTGRLGLRVNYVE